MSADPPDRASDRPIAGTGPKGVWALAWPSMTAFGLQSMTGFVNMLIVAALGTEAVAAVGISSQIHFVLFAVLAAVSTGTVALVARAVGAGDHLEADRVLRLSALMATGIAALAMLAAPIAMPVVATFGVEADVANSGAALLRILLAFSVPFAWNQVLSSALRGAGDVRTPLLVGVCVNLVDVVACYALVYGKLGAPELGVAGAAWATGIGVTAGSLIYGALWARNQLAIRRAGWIEGMDRERARRILRVGLPTALEQAAFQIGLWIFLRLVAGYGTEPVAAYLIGVRILSLSFIPGLGFAAASSTLVGQHLGAGDPDGAMRAGWHANALAMLVMGSVGLLVIAFANPLANAFGAAGEETVALTVVFIYVLGAAQPLMAVEFALAGALRGAGDTRFPLAAILTSLFVFRLGGALLVSRVFDASIAALWSCLLADYAVKALMLVWRFASRRWQHVEM